MSTTTRPSLEELEATLRDQAQMTALLQDPARHAQFVKDYAEAKTEQAGAAHLDAQIDEQRKQAYAELVASLGQQVDERVDQRLGAQLRDGDVARPDQSMAPVPAVGVQSLYNRRAPGAQIDTLVQGDYRAFLQNVWYRNNRPEAAAFRDKATQIQNAFGSTIGADGGFLIPERLRSDLLRVALETAVVRPRARVIPMDSLRVPFPVVDDTSHVSSVHGGMIGYWTEESGALTQSSATFGRIVLEAKKLTGYSEVPNELFLDAIGSFQVLIEELWPEAISFFEDDAFINGSGVGDPLGFLNTGNPSLVSVSRTTADLFAWNDITAMYSRMLPAGLSRAVWLCSPDTLPQIFGMTIPVKNVAGTENVGGSAVYITDGTKGPALSILGRPLIVTEKVPKLADPNALSFVDLGYYLIGDRQAMRLETSPHYKFANDQTAVRIIERVDGRPWLLSALTPKNGASATLSAFVGSST